MGNLLTHTSTAESIQCSAGEYVHITTSATGAQTGQCAHCPARVPPSNCTQLQHTPKPTCPDPSTQTFVDDQCVCYPDTELAVKACFSKSAS